MCLCAWYWRQVGTGCRIKRGRKILSCDWVNIHGVWIWNRIYWDLTKHNYKYDSLTDLHRLLWATAHLKSSQSSLAVAWYRLPTTDVLLVLCSRIIPDLNYQLLTSHKCYSQPKYSSLHSSGTDHTENALSIVACSLVAEKTCVYLRLSYCHLHVINFPVVCVPWLISNIIQNKRLNWTHRACENIQGTAQN